MSDSSTAMTRPQTSTELMPPPLMKRIKRPPTALEEDTYTSALSHIIARDFFPGLLETRTQQEYLDALESGQDTWIASARERLEDVMTPREGRGRGRGTSMTPTAWGTPMGTTAGRDTPMSVVSVATTASTPEVDQTLSLDAFHTKYTSEDNESFYRVLDTQNARRADRYRWLWSGNKIAAPRQILHRQREEKKIRGKTDDSGDNDDRKATPDAWPVKAPDNRLMFAPEGIEDKLETRVQAAEASSRAAPKAVVHDNTRMPPPMSDAVPPSPSLSAVHDALSGRRRSTTSDDGSETPRVNGYSFVDDEPTPSELGVAPSSLSLLPSSGDGSNPFSIKEANKREDLHRRMVDKVARNNRPTPSAVTPGARSVAGTPVPRFMSSPRFTAGLRRDARGGLTPAQERLWSNVRVARTPGGGFGAQAGGRVGGHMREWEGVRGKRAPTPRAGVRAGRVEK